MYEILYSHSVGCDGKAKTFEKAKKKAIKRNEPAGIYSNGVKIAVYLGPKLGFIMLH